MLATLAHAAVQLAAQAAHFISLVISPNGIYPPI